jgi:hypothetical protein
MSRAKVLKAVCLFLAGFYLPAAGLIPARLQKGHLESPPVTHEIDVKRRRDDQSPAHVPGVCVTTRLFMNSVVFRDGSGALRGRRAALIPRTNPERFELPTLGFGVWCSHSPIYATWGANIP